MSVSDCVQRVKNEFPSLDDDISQYIESKALFSSNRRGMTSLFKGVLETSCEDFQDGNDVFEAIGGVLQEVATNGKTEEDIKKLCDQLLHTLKPEAQNGGGSAVSERKILDAPVQIGSIVASNANGMLDDTSSIWIQKVEDNLVSFEFSVQRKR